MPERILIRADGSTQIGTGHVMRCLALAQGWQRGGGQAIFVQAHSTPALENRLRLEGIEMMRVKVVPGSEEDAAQTAQQARACEAAWVVADGYRFGDRWQRQIKAAGLRLLLLDDHAHAEYYSADMVLNQNLNADASLYAAREPYTQLLLGTRYAQIRREFLAWADAPREFPPVARSVLVTLGGSDPKNVTSKVLEALIRLPDLNGTVVVGGSNPHYDQLAASASRHGPRIRLERDSSRMAELMAQADFAVAAAGSTTWEMAFMGLPGLLIVVADNQRQPAKDLAEAGLFANLGEPESLMVEQLADHLSRLARDPGLRRTMSRKARVLVDGLGPERVSQALSRVVDAA